MYVETACVLSLQMFDFLFQTPKEKYANLIILKVLLSKFESDLFDGVGFLKIKIKFSTCK
jgi:hypothetical protein